MSLYNYVLGAVLAGSMTLVAGFGLQVVSAPIPSVKVQQASPQSLQPFGVGAEDDVTAQLVVQPTQSPQVTLNSIFIQGSK